MTSGRFQAHLQDTIDMTRFQRLCVGLCNIVQAPRFPLGEAIEGSLAFHMNRQGVVVNALYFPQTCADHVFVLSAAHGDL